MADAWIGSSEVTVPIPLNYIHEPRKLESITRTLDGTMIVNYAVTTGDQAITKYHFELPGITGSERKDIRAQALKTGNMSYIDHIQIPEVLTCTGTTGTITINLLRELGSTSYTTEYIDVTLNSSDQEYTTETPSTGEYSVTTTGAITFGPSTAGTNNVTVNYIPNYTVHILSDSHELLYKTSTGGHVTRYNLILEEG
ncbi:hypothetical protein ES705_41226 [subsurface metagenome]